MFSLEKKASIPICGPLMKLRKSMDRRIERFEVTVRAARVEVQAGRQAATRGRESEITL
jgi:hypothetical protein